MSNEELVKLARKANCGHESMTLDWIIPEGLHEFANLIEQVTLESAAIHFDKRGRHIDGGWSEGWYEPSEPGEIIRGMVNNRVQ